MKKITMKRKIGDQWEDERNNYICTPDGIKQFEKYDTIEKIEFVVEVSKTMFFLKEH